MQSGGRGMRNGQWNALALAGARGPQDEERFFAPLPSPRISGRAGSRRMAPDDGDADDMGAAFAAAGESGARLGLFCFGAGEMLGYTATPVGGLVRLTGGVRSARRARRNTATVDYL